MVRYPSNTRKFKNGKCRINGIKIVISVPRNKATILRRNKSEKASINGILALYKGKNPKKKPSVLATAPPYPVTGANKDLTIHLNIRFTEIPPYRCKCRKSIF